MDVSYYLAEIQWATKFLADLLHSYVVRHFCNCCCTVVGDFSYGFKFLYCTCLLGCSDLFFVGILSDIFQVQLKMSQTYYTYGWVWCVFAALFDRAVLVRAVTAAGRWLCVLALRRKNVAGQTAPQIRIIPTHKYNKFGSFWVELERCPTEFRQKKIWAP